MTFCAGVMLRALVEEEKLHRALLSVECVERLAGLITDATFDVSSDAIDSFIVRLG